MALRRLESRRDSQEGEGGAKLLAKAYRPSWLPSILGRLLADATSLTRKCDTLRHSSCSLRYRKELMAWVSIEAALCWRSSLP